MAAFQSFHPSPQPYDIIVNEHEFLFRVPVGKVCGRDYISGIDGEKRQPLIETPLIQKGRLLVKKVLHLLSKSWHAVIVSSGRCFWHCLSPLISWLPMTAP
jgi:hypothetical protein